MLDRITQDDLIRYVSRAALDPALRAEIHRQSQIVGSDIQRWIAAFDAKLRDPLAVNWGEIAKLQEDVEGDSALLPLIPSEHTDPPDHVNKTESEPDLDYFFDLELAELMSEFDDLALAGAAYRGPADHPLAPYLASLKVFVCETWNWPDRRAKSEYQDPREVASQLAQALADAQLELPFPAALVAVTLVKTGLDRMCKGVSDERRSNNLE